MKRLNSLSLTGSLLSEVVSSTTGFSESVITGVLSTGVLGLISTDFQSVTGVS